MRGQGSKSCSPTSIAQNPVISLHLDAKGIAFGRGNCMVGSQFPVWQTYGWERNPWWTASSLCHTACFFSTYSSCSPFDAPINHLHLVPAGLELEEGEEIWGKNVLLDWFSWHLSLELFEFSAKHWFFSPWCNFVGSLALPLLMLSHLPFPWGGYIYNSLHTPNY